MRFVDPLLSKLGKDRWMQHMACSGVRDGFARQGEAYMIVNVSCAKFYIQ